MEQNQASAERCDTNTTKPPQLELTVNSPIHSTTSISSGTDATPPPMQLSHHQQDISGTDAKEINLLIEML